MSSAATSVTERAASGAAAGDREAPILARHPALIGRGGDLVEGVRSLAVLRAGGLGDLMFVLPALEALAAAYPAARITLLGTGWQEDLLSSRPSPVDRVVPLPAIRGVTAGRDADVDPGAIEAVSHRLAAEHFDLAIQVHGGGRHSNPFVRRLGARVTAGLQAADAEPLDRTARYVYYQSEVLRALEVVGLVGAAPVTLEPRLPVTDADRRDAARALGVPTGGAGVPSPLVVLHPGAGDSRRRWPAASFAAVGDALAGDGATVAVSGSPGERGLAAEVTGAMRHAAIDLAGRVGLPGLVGTLAAADLVISNDSGPLHVAMAVGAATIGIFWCGNLINAGPFSRDRHRPAISWQLECPVCGLDCTRGACQHRDSFVAAVAVEEVLESARDLLREREERGAGSPWGVPAVEGAPG